jgi:hypothetical protein
LRGREASAGGDMSTQSPRSCRSPHDCILGPFTIVYCQTSQLPSYAPTRAGRICADLLARGLSPQLDVDHLDFNYVDGCNDVPTLQAILQRLKSGKEGHYPQVGGDDGGGGDDDNDDDDDDDGDDDAAHAMMPRRRSLRDDTRVYGVDLHLTAAVCRERRKQMLTC